MKIDAYTDKMLRCVRIEGTVDAREVYGNTDAADMAMRIRDHIARAVAEEIMKEFMPALRVAIQNMAAKGETA
jgi:hypothetical protein